MRTGEHSFQDSTSDNPLVTTIMSPNYWYDYGKANDTSDDRHGVMLNARALSRIHTVRPCCSQWWTSCVRPLRFIQFFSVHLLDLLLLLRLDNVLEAQSDCGSATVRTHNAKITPYLVRLLFSCMIATFGRWGGREVICPHIGESFHWASLSMKVIIIMMMIMMMCKRVCLCTENG